MSKSRAEARSRTRTSHTGQKTRPTEKGSALLIVFVFAAMVAIMLYMEMPVAVFEAQRQKEQLLIDRGDEYKRAVKLFVRKVGTYPASLEALEDTNRMRFLRHKFKDPFTGSDDWRLLHAGPGGMLLDSKVNPLKGMGGLNGGGGFSSGSNSSFGSTASAANSGFGSSGFSSFGSNTSSAPVVVARSLPQRAPAISANGAGAYQAPANGQALDANGLPPLLPSGDAGQSFNDVQTDQGVQVTNEGASVPGQTPTGTAPGQPGVAQTGAITPGAAPADGSNAMQAVRPLLSNPNGPAPAAVADRASPLGRIRAGGIAGVASKAEGHSIKRVNDQTDYSLWEFYYDPSKDLIAGGGRNFQTSVSLPPGTAGSVLAPGFQAQPTDQSLGITLAPGQTQPGTPGLAPHPRGLPPDATGPPPSQENPPQE